MDASSRGESVTEQLYYGFHPIHRSVSCDEGMNAGSFRVLTVHRFGDRDESGGHRRPSPSMAFVSGLWTTHSSREWSSPSSFNRLSFLLTLIPSETSVDQDFLYPIRC